jgi:hypothetical protein
MKSKTMKSKTIKKIFFFIVVLGCSISYSQNSSSKKWYSTADLEFINPSNVEYDYGIYSSQYNAIIGKTDEITNAKPSFGVSYSFNYNILKKLSVGLLTGYQNHARPDFSMLKLGGVIKYFFVDNNNVYTYINVANNFSLNKEQFNNGANFRLGLGFPVLKRDAFNLNINAFWEQNFLRMDGAKPLFDKEEPNTTVLKSYGISVGIKF